MSHIDKLFMDLLDESQMNKFLIILMINHKDFNDDLRLDCEKAVSLAIAL